MSAVAVEKLVDQVKHLSDEERQLFDELLARLEEEEWRRGAGEARRLARDRGIDQEVIDRAVSSVRYGT